MGIWRVKNIDIHVNLLAVMDWRLFLRPSQPVGMGGVAVGNAAHTPSNKQSLRKHNSDLSRLRLT